MQFGGKAILSQALFTKKWCMYSGGVLFGWFGGFCLCFVLGYFWLSALGGIVSFFRGFFFLVWGCVGLLFWFFFVTATELIWTTWLLSIFSPHELRSHREALSPYQNSQQYLSWNQFWDLEILTKSKWILSWPTCFRWPCFSRDWTWWSQNMPSNVNHFLICTHWQSSLLIKEAPEQATLSQANTWYFKPCHTLL